MKPMRILFTGVGGQGTLTASSLLAQAALLEGKEAVMSEVHGMAQRGGVVESTVMFGGLRSPLISEGEADILVSFEPLEAIRALAKCHSDATIITNTVPIVPFTVDLGGPKYPDIEQAIEKMKEGFKRVIALDAEEMAREAGTSRAVNVVLLGVLLGTGLVAIRPESMEETIRMRVKERFVEANIKALHLGLEAGRDTP